MVAMGFFSGDSNLARICRMASHVTSFGNMVYQNSIPIGITAAVTVLATSYDKPIVMYSTLGACNAYLFYRCIRLEKNMDRLLTVHENHARNVSRDINSIKSDTSSLKTDVTKLNGDIEKITPMLNDRADSLAERILHLKGLIEAHGENVEKQEESITALTTKLGAMRSGIEDLTAKQHELNDLVATEATETRKLINQNAKRIFAALGIPSETKAEEITKENIDRLTKLEKIVTSPKTQREHSSSLPSLSPFFRGSYAFNKQAHHNLQPSDNT